MNRLALNNIFKKDIPSRVIGIIDSSYENTYVIYDTYGRKYMIYSSESYKKGDWVVVENKIIVGKTVRPTEPKIYEV